MQYRLARLDDVAELAAVHLAAASEQQSSNSGGFLKDLGPNYLREYYRVFLQEPNSLILCAVDEQGSIAGLCSGTMAAEEHRDALRKHRYRLFLSMLPALVRNPRLIAPVLRRARSLTGAEGGYVWLQGPRWEYWGWDPARHSAEAVVLEQKWMAMLQLLGAETVVFEVDEANVRVVEFHKRMGSRVERDYVTPDGNRRLQMRYDFSE